MREERLAPLDEKHKSKAFEYFYGAVIYPWPIINVHVVPKMPEKRSRQTSYFDQCPPDVIFRYTFALYDTENIKTRLRKPKIDIFLIKAIFHRA